MLLQSLHPVFDLVFSFNRSIFLLQFCNHFNPSKIENNAHKELFFRRYINSKDIFPRSKYFPSLWIHNILSKQIILRDHSALGGQLWSQSLRFCARCDSQNRPELLTLKQGELEGGRNWSEQNLVCTCVCWAGQKYWIKGSPETQLFTFFSAWASLRKM